MFDFLIVEPIISCVKLVIFLVDFCSLADKLYIDWSTANQDVQGVSDGEKIIIPSLSFTEVNSLNFEPDSEFNFEKYVKNIVKQL